MTRLEELLAALDASKLALRRDECGDYRINGKSGHMYPDGRGFLLYVSTGESPRRWTNVKSRLGGFCRLTQDCDDEGALHLDHLPSPTEATIMREAFGIKRKRDHDRGGSSPAGARQKSASAASGGLAFVFQPGRQVDSHPGTENAKS